MTTIYYVPDKGSRTFIAPPEKEMTLMDVTVVDTAGLIGYLESVLGIRSVEEAFNVRLCRYYRLLKDWIDVHPENVLCRSFQLAHLSTTRRMLLWRDELKLAQWDFSFSDSASRLGALAGVEETGIVRGLPDRIIEVILRLESPHEKRCLPCRLVLNIDRRLLPPVIGRLLDAMEKHGAVIGCVEFAPDGVDNLTAVRNLLLSEDKISIELDPQDRSFEILKFDTYSEESEYVAVCQHDFGATLFINPNAKETDNRLAAGNLPTSGSEITSRSRILNLMPLALSLFDQHLQITKLVEWFTAPVHPLPGRFRFQLAEQIARSGGFHNEGCRRIVDNFIRGDYEYPDENDKLLSATELEKLMKRRLEERRDALCLYVPYLEDDYRQADKAERTLKALSVWARRRVRSLADDDNREAVATQLNALADSIDILILLFSERGEIFDLSLAAEWVRDIPSVITLPNHPARVGSVFTVSKPCNIIAPAARIVWVGMENDDLPAFECDFLLPAERSAIQQSATFWSREHEARFRYLNTVMPFRFATEKITLVCAVKRNGELIVPHPLMTRLNIQIGNIDRFIVRKDIEDKRTIPVADINNSISRAEHHFANADRIVFPERMSATGLETFTLFPFDFMFERLLNFQTAGLSSLPELHTTKGNVAHATIARLFSPPEGCSGLDAEEIRRIVECSYEKALQESINECGAIFMLPEHKLEKSNLEHQLRNCIESLLDIIGGNFLTVEACEKHFSKFVDINGSGGEDDDLHGYIDMKLSDKEGNHVVFDLKWTSSRSYHQSLLEKNRSIQLAVYNLLVRETEREVRTAYFLMPRGRLVSCHPFRGRNVVTVEADSSTDIMQQLVNSYRFRCRQLSEGVLENGEKHPMENLAYGKESSACNLFPLPEGEDSGMKGENRFSSYRLFKGF